MLAESMRSVWPLLDDEGGDIGIVTSRAWSPKFNANIAFAIVASAHAGVGSRIRVDVDGDVRQATVHDARWRSLSQQSAGGNAVT